MLLRDFFRAEMPDPLPGMPAFREKRQTAAHVLRPARPWNRARRHMALAAAIGLMLVGYWTLSAVFPSTLPPAQLPLHNQGTVGEKLAPNILPDDSQPEVDANQQGMHNTPRAFPTKSGKALVSEYSVDGKIIINVELQPKTGNNSNK